MIKIIFLAYDPDNMEESYNFDMLEEKFDSVEEAKDFLLHKEFPQLFDNLVDNDDPSDFGYDIEDFGDSINFTIYVHEEVSSITEYKILEV